MNKLEELEQDIKILEAMLQRALDRDDYDTADEIGEEINTIKGWIREYKED